MTLVHLNRMGQVCWPPHLLGISQYGDVEAYLGLAVIAD
jgi:hypothetical protein